MLPRYRVIFREAFQVFLITFKCKKNDPSQSRCLLVSALCVGYCTQAWFTMLLFKITEINLTGRYAIGCVGSILPLQASIGSTQGGVAMLVDNTITGLTLINTILVTLAR